MVGPPPLSWEVDAATAGARLVTDGLWRLRLPLPWEGNGHVNAYVVALDDGAMLVDCGSAGDGAYAEALERAIGETGFALADIRRLVLTHTHTDHAGLARWVVDRVGCPVWMHPDGSRLFDVLRAPDATLAARERLARREGIPESRLGPLAGIQEELEGLSGIVVADQPLVEGTVVPSALGPWEVLETPGHAASHVCLLQRERRIAIVADLLCAAFVPWLEYGDTPDPYADYQASLDRLEALGPLDIVLPGHGRTLQDPMGTITLYREGLAAGLQEVRAALAAGPATAYELTERIHGHAASDLLALEQIAMTLVYLVHLRATGEAVREERADGIRIHRVVS